ncbi:hypothetical protein DQ04_00201140 [Trypanosoma grayi]|uniref:hypothetical protein n=1 Tax=Trypanosoma grayi TaxID=71804 RepID=UPI0004F45696|nr:hypothetical protein DQ04_00201140 [Trypanosoma grayi]KEG15061.1 hypothetical protein DQ04_00201140 [Trypanosoma grayi]
MSDALVAPTGGPFPAVRPLHPHEVVKIRAAHRLPSLTVAVEGAYQFLRSLTWGGRIRAVRVVALPSASHFTVELRADYQHCRDCVSVGLVCNKGGEVEWLPELSAVSEEVRLCVAAEFLLRSDVHGRQSVSLSSEQSQVLFEKRWSHTNPLSEEETVTRVRGVVAGQVQAQLRQLSQQQQHRETEKNSFLMAVRLRCEVRGLFCCMPVRRQSASRQSHTLYRLRAERQALLMAAYRMSLECVLAPLYLSSKKDTDHSASLYLRVGSDDKEGRAAADAADATYVSSFLAPSNVEVTEPLAKRQRTEARSEASSQKLSVAYRVLGAFFPDLRLSDGASDCVRGSALLRLCEVVVKRGVFAVLFLLPSSMNHHGANGLWGLPSPPSSYHKEAAAVVVVSMHAASATCFVVDESHWVHRHVARISATSRPLLVLMAESLLQGDGGTLRSMFGAAVRGYHRRAAPLSTRNMPNSATEDDEERTEAVCVVGKLTAPCGALRADQIAPTAALRVSFLSQLLSSTGRTFASKRSDGAVLSVPRRTPFYPLKWKREYTCGTSSLAQARSAMQLELDPAQIAVRAYGVPAVWPRTGDVGHAESRRGRCPFRAEHFIAQWDRKFLLLCMGGPGMPHSNALVDESVYLSLSQCATKTSRASLPARLYLVDQHAVHERLRLEFFLSFAESYVQHGSAPASFTVEVPADICRDVVTYEAMLKRWGWRFAHSNGAVGAASFSHTPVRRVSVTCWPRLVVEGHALLLDSVEALRATVEEFAIVLPPTSTVAAPRADCRHSKCGEEPRNYKSAVPSVILQFLVKRSCRGAVMFGDRLSRVDAEKLIEALQAVEQYTVCSHGRPAFAAVRSRG